MGIEGASPAECFERFRAHIAKLAKDIIDTKSPIRCAGDLERRILTFTNAQHEDAVPIQTAEHGTVFLYIAQELEIVKKGRRLYRLRTRQYWYKLFSAPPSVSSDAVLRWEYSRQEAPWGRWCPNHIQFAPQDGQGAPAVRLGTGELDLNRMHVPTGWVLIEYVFRFLIHELGMQPPCGDRWPQVLHDSEEAFFNDFAT